MKVFAGLPYHSVDLWQSFHPPNSTSARLANIAIALIDQRSKRGCPGGDQDHFPSQCLISVSLGTPTCAEMSRQLSPCLRSFRAQSVSTLTAGRPKMTPRRFAALCPAMTRSLIVERSSSATDARIVNTILPVGVDV
jgi:hypothetical protein